MARVAVSSVQISWEPLVDYASATLTVSTPGVKVIRWEFGVGTPIVLNLHGKGGVELGDGLYIYELVLTPRIDAGAAGELQRARETGDQTIVEELRRQGRLPDSAMVMSGAFRVTSGAIVVPREEAVTAKYTHEGDVVIHNSLCVGLECVDPETFGYDTIRLKEDNLRIHFDDTSDSPWPANDWRIVINDTTSGGAGYFAVQDATAGLQVFRVDAGARANSLYVASNGAVGLGTATPVGSLHFVRADTPRLRFQQSGGPWTPQTWDVAGNEANFFVMDITNGSKLPFRIRPGAPTSSIDIAATGNVGIGTDSPDAPLEVERDGANAELRLDRVDSGEWSLQAGADDTFTIGKPGGPTFITLKGAGTLILDAPLAGPSDRNIKQGFEPLDREALLARVAALDISEWSFISEGSAVRHIGPMAQDFKAAFGLGQDDTHITLSDLGGVALAAIQELDLQLQQKDAEIDQLRNRLDRLEAALHQCP